MTAYPWHCMAPQRIVIIYDRISKDQSGTKDSPANQRKANRATAALFEPDQIIEYTDRDKSASDTNVVRDDFQRLLRDVRSGMFDGAMIVAWAQDRFLRDDVEYATTKRLLDEHNIRFYAPRDGVDLVPEGGGGEMISGMRQLFAAEEIRKMKARIALKLSANRAAGKRHGKVPFGWNPDGTLEPEQAEMVRDAARRVLRGETMSSICEQWNAEGKPRMSFVKRSEGGVKLEAEDQVLIVLPWETSRLSSLLRRPANAALFVHKGMRCDVAGAWEPILSEDEWSAVCGKTVSRKASKPNRSLLGGLIICAREECGGPVWGVTNRSEGHTYVIYRCGKCSQTVKQAVVHQYVETLVVTALTGMKPADLVDDARKGDMEKLVERIAQLKGRLLDANDRYADIDRQDAIDSATHAQLVGKLGPALAKAEQERDRLTQDASGGEVLAGMIGPGAPRAWAGASLARKQAILRLMTELYLCPGDRFTPVEVRIDARLRRSLGAPAQSGLPAGRRRVHPTP